MGIPHVSFSLDEVALLRAILDEVATLLPVAKRTTEAKTLLAQKILACAANGERDPVKLRSAALLEWKADRAPVHRDQPDEMRGCVWWGG